MNSCYDNQILGALLVDCTVCDSNEGFIYPDEMVEEHNVDTLGCSFV